jgi:hypothetical protein
VLLFKHFVIATPLSLASVIKNTENAYVIACAIQNVTSEIACAINNSLLLYQFRKKMQVYY